MQQHQLPHPATGCISDHVIPGQEACRAAPLTQHSAGPPTREPADTAVTRSAQSSAMMHQMQLCRF